MRVLHAQLARAGLCVILLFMALLLPVGRVVYAQNSTVSDPSKDIIVVFKSRPTIQLLSAVSNTATQNLEIKNGIAATNAMVFTVTSGDVKSTMDNLRRDPNVEAVFPNYTLQLQVIPNDPQVQATPAPGLPRDQWYLFNTNFAGTGQSAWDVTTGSSSIKVAVIDTGIQSDHADFKNSDNSSKIDSFVDCSSGTCGTVNTMTDNLGDEPGHGTAVAGVIGAATNNSNGIAGTGYNTKLMIIKILDSSGSTNIDRVINALTWAADNGAKVINLSVGIPADGLDSAAITQFNNAVAYAWNKGSVIVAAAGNCGGNTQGDPHCAYYQNNSNVIAGYASNPKLYPAASPNVISVAALTVNNALAAYSEHNDSANANIGNWIDVAAPGGDGSCTGTAKTCILSTIPTNQMSWLSGTSLAAPQVSGLAALLFAVNPNFTNTQVKSIIENTANNSIASGSTNHGLINALAAVQQAGSTTAVTATPTPIGGAPSTTPNPNASPTITPTSGPTATPTVTPYPTTAPKLPRQFPSPMPAGPYCPVITGCPQKATGDANCDGKVDSNDYNLWTQQFDTLVPASPNNQNSNFMCVEGNTTTYFADLVDYEIWRRNTTSGLIMPTATPTPVPTSTPVPTAVPIQPTSPPAAPPPADNPPGPPADPPRQSCSDDSSCPSGQECSNTGHCFAVGTFTR